MSKKLEKNGLWESSRMMLPQHREALQNRRSDKPVEPQRPTAEEMELLRDFILLPIMHAIVIKKAREVQSSSETLRLLYSKVAQVLARNIQNDLTVVKRHLSERSLRVVEEEKEEYMIHYRYTCRGTEDRFTIARDYMRAELSRRIGRYADNLVAMIYGAKPEEPKG